MRNVFVSIWTLIVASLPLAVAAQDKVVELRFSHWLPTTHAVHGTALEWAKSINQASNGTIKIAVFPAQQLGKAVDHYDMTAKGLVDIAYISTGYQPGRMLVTGVTQLPFLMDNADNGSKALDQWYRPYAAKDMPGIKMCLMFVYDPGTLHSKMKITNPSQLQGIKVRVPNPSLGAWTASLGGTPKTLPAPEVRGALERGEIDAVLFPWESTYLFKFDGVTKYHINIPMFTTSFAWIINPDKYASLSAAQKKVIDNHCTSEWAYRVGKEWGDQEASGRTRAKADPMHVVSQLSPVDVAAWKRSAQPLVASWSEEMRKQGYDPVKMLNDLNRTLLINRAKM